MVAVVVLSWLGVGFALVAGFCFLLASCLLLAACWFCLPLLLTYWFRLLQFAADLSLFADPARRWLARVRWPCYLLAAECWLLVGVDNGPCVPSQVLGCLGYSMEPNDKYITVGRTAYCDIFICDTYVSDREFRISRGNVSEQYSCGGEGACATRSCLQEACVTRSCLESVRRVTVRVGRGSQPIPTTMSARPH